ncbi:MAG: helix-turn-helix domain-containing protein [Candidatus Aramenus sp.]|jgi:putative transcriptional regulator|nr:helix-turn-helix domain-containing protein [Candidatus Aramenus sp.]
MEDKLTDVVDILEKSNVDYSVIYYPEKSKKSIDIVAKDPSRKLVIKVSMDKVSKEEIVELEKFAYLVNSFPVLVTDETEEDIAIQKDKVVGLSLEGFRKMIEREKIFVYRTRGGMFVKIRSEVMKRKREEMRFSMGDLAKMLGVSRKTIYDYENGECDVSIEIAEKLVDIFGPEIIGDMFEDMNNRSRIELENEENNQVSKILADEGFSIATLKLTAVDVVASRGDERVLIAIGPKRADFTRRKAEEAKKLAMKLSASLITIVRTYNMAKDLEKDGFKAYTTDDLTSLRDEIKRDNRGKG